MTSTPDDLVSAARTCDRSGEVAAVASVSPGTLRVFVPGRYGDFFDVPEQQWPLSAAGALALAEQLLVAGHLAQADAAGRFAMRFCEELTAGQADLAHAIHVATHAARCCLAHSTHSTPHRGCVLR